MNKVGAQMAKEKNQPRGSKNQKILSKDAEATLYGLMTFLVALIGLLNRGLIGNFLTFIFVYIFGVFYFVAFLIAIFYGLYLLVKKKAYAIKINSLLLGLVLLLLASIIGASLGVEGLTFSNLFTKFQSLVPTETGSYFLISFANIGQTGGGLLGFFLAALLNVTITSIGAAIFVAIVFLVGLYLTFGGPSSKMYTMLKSKLKARKEKRAQKALEEEETLPTPVVEAPKYESNSLRTYDSYPSGGVKKASFAGVTEMTGSSSLIKQTNPIAPPPSKKELFVDDIEEEIAIEPTIPEIMVTSIETPSPAIVSTPTPVITSHHETPIERMIRKPKLVEGINASGEVKKSNGYKFPPRDLLTSFPNENNKEINEEASIKRQEIINQTFADLNTGATATSYKVGPRVTRFDILANSDVSVNAINKVIDDVAVRLGGVYTRYAKVVPGKTTTGLEVPNVNVDTIYLKDVLEELDKHPEKKLLIPFGKDIAGDVIYESIQKFPHLLVAGTSGSGKSVFNHVLIMSLIMRHTPEEVRLILIDPKRVEMSFYRDSPHLFCPLISEPVQAKVALTKLVQEMENRFTLMEQAGVSDLKQYNAEMEETGEPKLPYLIVVIDEYADLVDSCRDIEIPVVRIAQKARAAGIHVVIATQRPSTNVVTGVLKGNLATRVALMVSSPVDSVTILGQGGAETLLGNGDMLLDCATISRGAALMRVQSPFVENKDIKRVVAFLKENYPVDYNKDFLDLKDRSAMGPAFMGGQDNAAEDDPQYDEVKEFVMSRNFASTALIQRMFGFGHPRASRLFAALQREGIIEKTVEGSTSSKGAKVLIKLEINEDEIEDEDEID